MSGESRSRRVLVVESDEPSTEVYSTVLQTAYDVDTATDGAEALDLVDDGYDVVVLDRRTPEAPGEEVLEAIHRRGLDCQVVTVSAITPDLSVVSLPWADHVVESVGADTIREVIERVLRVAEYSDRRTKLSSKKLKRNVLEAELNEDALEDSAKYQRLRADVERLEAEVAAIEDDLDSEEIERAL